MRHPQYNNENTQEEVLKNENSKNSEEHSPLVEALTKFFDKSPIVERVS